MAGRVHRRDGNLQFLRRHPGHSHPGETNKPAKRPTTVYRDVLSQPWLLDPVPGWLPSRIAFTRTADGLNRWT
ncbi:MAG TPA: hypothetical protein VFW27_09235 [Actinoplanes sp.]|jgi:hypothetical protein|nr:hypothetical protein [Actinoplanes sp.]